MTEDEHKALAHLIAIGHAHPDIPYFGEWAIEWVRWLAAENAGLLLDKAGSDE